MHKMYVSILFLLYRGRSILYGEDMSIQLDDLNLHKAEQLLCETALEETGTIVDAAKLLGITRHALKRRIVKYNIDWPPGRRAALRKLAQQQRRSGGR